MKRKLYETFARHLKGGAWARVGRTEVWALGAERIRLAMKTYTSWLGAEFASSDHGA